MPEQSSLFAGFCWQCWPALSCKCKPHDTEAGRLCSEVFLLDRELQRENRRAREFADELRSLAAAVWQVRESRIEADGLDGLPADLFDLGQQAQRVAAVMAEPRNEDRVSALYRRLESRAAAALGGPTQAAGQNPASGQEGLVHGGCVDGRGVAVPGGT